MKKRRDVPTLKEIDRYFPLGEDMQGCFYIEKLSSRRKGRFQIDSERTRLRTGHSLSRIIREYLPPSDQSTRLMIVETTLDLQRITRAAIDEKITTLQMEPINY